MARAGAPVLGSSGESIINELFGRGFFVYYVRKFGKTFMLVSLIFF